MPRAVLITQFMLNQNFIIPFISESCFKKRTNKQKHKKQETVPDF